MHLLPQYLIQTTVCRQVLQSLVFFTCPVLIGLSISPGIKVFQKKLSDCTLLLGLGTIAGGSFLRSNYQSTLLFMNEVIIDFSKVHRIQVGGMTILEPSTVLSSLAMTAICLYAFFQLRKLGRTHIMYEQLRYFFLFMAIATAVGGVLGHGFLYLTGQPGKIPGWFASMIAVALFERAAISHIKPLLPRRAGVWLGWLNYVELSIFFALTLLTLNFIVVEIHAFYGLFLMLFSIELYVYKKKKDPGSMNIFIATFWGAVAAGLHALKFSIGPWFNYNDISHVAMAASIWYYYRGAAKMIYYGQEMTAINKKAYL